MRRTLVVLIGLVLSGCHTQDISPGAGLGDPYPPPLNDPQYSVLSPQLRPWLRFHPARISDTGERPLQVEVPVRNLAARQYLVDYRIVFFDANDLEIEPVMGWRFTELYPKQVARLKAGAMGPGAVSYRLEIKWAQ